MLPFASTRESLPLPLNAVCERVNTYEVLEHVMGIHGLHPHSLDTIAAMRERLVAHCVATFPEGGVILDVGCGSGAGTAALAERLPANFRVKGLDINSQAIARARMRYPSAPRLVFHDGDLETLLAAEPGLQAVGAICVSVSMFIADTCTFYTRVHAALTPGGMFVDAPFALHEGALARDPAFQQKTYAMCGCNMRMHTCIDIQAQLEASGFKHTDRVEHGFDLMRLPVLFRDYPAPALLGRFVRNILMPPPALHGVERRYLLQRAVRIFAFFLRHRRRFRAGELIAIK